eukprot:1800277-Prymnesium_polylepis.1
MGHRLARDRRHALSAPQHELRWARHDHARPVPPRRKGGAEHEPGAAPGAQLERARSCVTRARTLGSEQWATEAQ